LLGLTIERLVVTFRIVGLCFVVDGDMNVVIFDMFLTASELLATNITSSIIPNTV
jgi:hypothetical protein